MRARPCKEKDIRRQRCRRISFFIEGQCLSESILYGGTAWESKRFVRGLLGRVSALYGGLLGGGSGLCGSHFWVSAVFPVGRG